MCVVVFFYLFWFQFGCARLTPNMFKSLRPDWSSNTNQLRCVNSRVCETHFVKCLFYLIARADVILAPHNLAAFLCECAVMVPGQLTTSWTRRGGSFLHQFHFEEAISDTQVSLAKGKLERLLFPVVCWKIFIHYPPPPLPHPPPPTAAAVSSCTDINWHTLIWTDPVSAFGTCPEIFLCCQ